MKMSLRGERTVWCRFNDCRKLIQRGIRLRRSHRLERPSKLITVAIHRWRIRIVSDQLLEHLDGAIPLSLFHSRQPQFQKIGLDGVGRCNCIGGLVLAFACKLCRLFRVARFNIWTNNGFRRRLFRPSDKQINQMPSRTAPGHGLWNQFVFRPAFDQTREPFVGFASSGYLILSNSRIQLTPRRAIHCQRHKLAVLRPVGFLVNHR